MSTARQKAQSVESEFLSGVQANLAAPSRPIRGAQFDVSEEYEAGPVRAALVDSGRFDRDLEREFPGSRMILCRGYEKRFLFFRREVSRTLACVIAPPAPLLDDRGTPPPVGLAELREFVRRRVGVSRSPVVVAICSPSGFRNDVWEAEWDQPNVRVVLAAPRGESGGWRVRGLWKNADDRLVQMFDPEGVADKLERVKADLESRSGDLLTGGLSASEMAQRLDLPMGVLARALTAATRADPELHVRPAGDDLVVFRGAPARSSWESGAMSVTDWLRSLFSSKGEEARKINLLSERRALLSQKRDRLYDDIAKLEQKEADLVRQGREAGSAVMRRRLAAQIAQLRRDLSRANTTAAMLNQQVNVISTHIHNLTLIQQGEMAKLPNAEDLTEDAVRAEELLETLRADADLVGNLETDVAESMMTQEEQDILKEFEPPAGDANRAAVPSAPAKAATKGDAANAADPDVDAIERELAEQPPAPPERRKSAAGPGGDSLGAE